MATPAGHDDDAPKPKGRKRKPREIEVNGPSSEALIDAIAAQVKLNAERAAFNAKVSAQRKVWKAAGLTLGVLDETVKMLEWSPEEVKAHFAERERYAVAVNLPVGDLLDLFDEREGGEDPEAESRRWYNIGKRNGLAGIGWPDEAPDGCPPEHAQSYGQGHGDGQADLMKAIKKRMESVIVVAPSEPETEDA